MFELKRRSTEARIRLAAMHLIAAAGLLQNVLDEEDLSGRFDSETARTIRDAMPGLNYVCDCVADLIPDEVTP